MVFQFPIICEVQAKLSSSNCKKVICKNVCPSHVRKLWKNCNGSLEWKYHSMVEKSQTLVSLSHSVCRTIWGR